MQRLLKLLSSRLLWGGIVLAGIALFLQQSLYFPKRPTGSRADIPKLAQRHDLNVVFILVDTLRDDHLSSYGYKRKTSPYLDRFAATGVKFTNVVAQSTFTKCSMASIWTSTYPTTNHINRTSDAVPPEVRMPAEILHDAGFKTAGIYRNGWVGANFGFGQGFDAYVQPPVVTTQERVIHRSPSEGPKLAGSDWDATSSAREYLRLHRHDRFFLYLHYMDVHQYVTESKSAIFGGRPIDSYDNAINWEDRNIAVIVSELEKLGLMDHTMVVVAADHGEAFGEHGTNGHAQNVYKEVDRVPLVFILPFFLKPGVTVTAPVENLDIWPTIFQLLGIPIPSWSQGESLVGLMDGTQKGDPHRVRYTFLDRNWGDMKKPPRPTVAVEKDQYRLVTWGDHSGPTELFDHTTDPREQFNIAASHPEETAALMSLADKFLKGTPPPWGAAPKHVDIDQMQLNMLKALGYVIDKSGKAHKPSEEAP